jgi:hypothetical protein
MAEPNSRPRGSRHAQVTSVPPPSESHEHIRAKRLSFSEKEIKYFGEFFTFAIGIGIFGGTITFSLIILDIREPTRMTQSTVQSLLAVSWLLFTIALGIASVSASLLNWYGELIKYEFQRDDGYIKWLWIDEGVSIALGASLLGAFLFASIVVMAYVMPVGIVYVSCKGQRSQKSELMNGPHLRYLHALAKPGKSSETLDC